MSSSTNNPIVIVTHTATGKKKKCSETESRFRNREIATQNLIVEIWESTNKFPAWDDFTYIVKE